MLYRQTKVSRRFCSRRFQYVLSSPEQLYDGEGEVLEVIRVDAPLVIQETSQEEMPKVECCTLSSASMPSTSKPETIDEYIAGFPPDVRKALKTVRATIRKALPGSEEAISYGIPTFRHGGGYVIYFAGWKKHFSLYPVTARLAERFKKELGDYEMSGKGTVRFPLSEPVPIKLVAAIAKFRAREAAEQRKVKGAAKAKVNRRG